MSKSNYAENLVLTTLLLSGTTYVALFITDPGETGASGECTGNGYARRSAPWGAVASGSITNTADINFPTSTGTWGGTAEYFAIFDALSGGNMLYAGALTPSVDVSTSNKSCRIDAGQLTVTEE